MPAAQLPLSHIVVVWTWVIIASSWFVMVEPAPYDLLLVGLAALVFTAGLRVPAELSAVVLLMALFILANIVSIVVARESVTQPVGVMVFYAAVTIYLLLSYVLIASLVMASAGRLLNVIWNAWILAAVIAALLAILSFFGIIPDAELFMKSGRAKGAFKDPNVFGPFLVPVILVLISRFRRPAAGQRLLVVIVFPILILGLFLSFSRGAWGNFVLSAITYAVLQVATLRSLKQYVSAAVAVLAIPVVAISILLVAQSEPAVQDMLEKRFSITQSYDVETGGRFWVQRQALAVALQTPLGVGPNRTESSFGMNPHNVYIKTVVENGWLGGVVFLITIVLIVAQGIRAATRDWPFRDSAIVVFSSLVGIVAESMIIDTLHWRHFFLLLGMMSGLTILMRHHRQPLRLNAADIRRSAAAQPVERPHR